MDHVAEDSPGEEACFDLRETLSFLQIGHLIQSGHSIKEIAKELKRSPKTVCDLIARVGRTDSAFPLVQRGLGTGARFELTSAGKTMLDLVIAAIPLRRARQVLQIFASHALVSNRVITACIADFLAKHSEMDVTIKFPTSIPFEDTVKEIGNTKLQSQSIGFFWGGETRAAISRNHGCRALRIGPQFDIVIVSHDRSLIREVNDVLANPDVDVLDQRSNGWIAAIGSKLQQKRPVQLNWLDPIPRLTEAAKPVIPPVKTETIDALLALVSADPTCYGIIPAIYECLDREGSNDIPYSLPVGKTDLIVVTPKDSAQDAVTEELVEPIREQLLLASIRPLRPGDITKHFPETLSKIKRYQYAYYVESNQDDDQRDAWHWEKIKWGSSKSGDVELHGTIRNVRKDEFECVAKLVSGGIVMTANALKQEKDRVSVFAFIAMFTHAFQTPNCLTGTWSSAVSQLSDPKATKFMFRSMILSEERLKLSQIRQIQRWTQRSVLVCDRGVDGFDDNASTGEKP